MDGPLWFIRDLMIFCVLPPIVYFIMRYRKFGFGVAIIMLLFNVKIAYFVFGAWCSLQNVDFVIFCKKLWRYLLPLWLLLIAMFQFAPNINITVKHIYVFMRTVVITGIAYMEGKELRKSTIFLASTSFFVFAFHQTLLLLLCKLWCKFIPVSDSTLLLGYFILPISISTTSVLPYATIQKVCLKLLGVMTGGR